MTSDCAVLFIEKNTFARAMAIKGKANNVARFNALMLPVYKSKHELRAIRYITTIAKAR